MFLDPFGLFCYHHADELRSDEAQILFEASGGKLTQSYVLAELVALSSARGLPRPKTLAFVKAMDLLEARLDKDYSLCDAVSFVLMKQRGLREALTTDHHFEQEGFTRLLK